MDGERILTGDTEGYVFAWDLTNCLDQSCGSEKLCMRAHNAMDPELYCKDADKIVYGVHLETAAMIQVAEFHIVILYYLMIYLPGGGA